MARDATLSLVIMALVALAVCTDDRMLPGGIFYDSGVRPRRDAGSEVDEDADQLDDVGLVCAELELPVVRVTPRVLIVLDRSYSMLEHRNWDTVRTAVAEITAELQWRLAFGLMVFPAAEGGMACDEGINGCSSPRVPNIGCAPGHGREIASRIEDMRTCGGTPTALTLRAAADYFIERLDPTHIPTGSWASSYVVLATDGAPNCNDALDGALCRCTAYAGCDWYPSNCLDDVETFEAIEALSRIGVPMFVLGISATEWHDVLDDMALRGGTGAAAMAEEPDSIYEALSEITEGLTTCEVELRDPGPVADPELVNFSIDGEVVPMTPGSECESGWRWVDERHRRVAFCGAACDRLRTGEIDMVRATFGCPTVY